MKNSGFKWGIFTARLPIIHMRVAWPELAQGLVVSLSTALALIPLLTTSFGLTFPEAVTIAMLHMMLVTSNVIIFGEPFASGWITPALPLVLGFVIGGYDNAVERFQMMTALSLDFAALTLLMGVTGWGHKLARLIPAALKAGIILGAALSAFKRIFYDDLAGFLAMPVSYILAIFVCLTILYLPAFQGLKSKYKLWSLISSFGLLPSFVMAGVFGGLMGELTFDITPGFLNPPFAALMEKVSPFSIGFPPLSYFASALPLTLIAYLILFGDLITGTSLIEDNQKFRPDDPVDINLTRSHYAVAIRNFLMAIIAPFFPTQGVLWAGAQIIIIERWKAGRDKLESLIGGISAFYYYGIPVVFLILPLVTVLKPFMPIALMLTLLLTGIACGRLALKIAKSMTDRTIMVLVSLLLTFFSPWVGLLAGGVVCLLVSAAKKKRVKR
ncbi:MAG: hypothetical protein KDF58_11665 [Alphaproteobacteria bacterium]|nr:hypothetical protein [Alphaproteobacteria bacterium]HPF46236.1 hypothetical protein [Emcibacteraceae bacterium]HRW28625.1 hypothetical protein [Emcibacteraceae bacterium]